MEQNEKLTVEQQLERYNHCMYDIFEFAKYAMIEDATNQKVIPMILWPHQKLLLAELLVPHAQIALGKAKQIGCSWTAALFHLWKCHRPATNILCFSKGEKEAARLLYKSRFINNNMPPWLKLKVGYDGQEYMMFSDTGSRITAFPSTKDAGLGETATHVTRDELDFHDFAEENFGHVSPTIDKGASILDMSTFDRAKPQSHFKTLYNRALRGENNYKALFFPWYVEPTRTREWYIQTRKKYFPVWLFEQDYPDNIEEAMGSIEGEGLFDRSSMNRLLKAVREPLEVLPGSISIYHRPNPKIRYYAGLDGAEGRGGNNSVLWIGGDNGFDKALCAIMCSNQMTCDVFATHAYRLLEKYGRPLLVGGIEPWTQMIMDYLVAMGYRDKICCSDDKGEKLGLVESENEKQQRLMAFAFAVKDGMQIPFKLAIDEMSGWTLKKSTQTGKSKYVSTYPTDDCILAGSLALKANELNPRDEEVSVDRYY